MLQVLVLHNLTVAEGGLRPLAGLNRLKALLLSNQFVTTDYACLAVHLAQTDCAQFAAYEDLASETGGKNVMATGRRKPFLNSRDAKDQKRLDRYLRDFEALKAEFRAEIPHKTA